MIRKFLSVSPPFPLITKLKMKGFETFLSPNLNTAPENRAVSTACHEGSFSQRELCPNCPPNEFTWQALSWENTVLTPSINWKVGSGFVRDHHWRAVFWTGVWNVWPQWRPNTETRTLEGAVLPFFLLFFRKFQQEGRHLSHGLCCLFWRECQRWCQLF